MSVEELIKKLQECDPNATVLVALDASDGYRLDCIEHEAKNIVCLVGATIDY